MVGETSSSSLSDERIWMSPSSSSEYENTISQLRVPDDRVCLVVVDGLGKIRRLYSDSNAVSAIP